MAHTYETNAQGEPWCTACGAVFTKGGNVKRPANPANGACS